MNEEKKEKEEKKVKKEIQFSSYRYFGKYDFTNKFEPGERIVDDSNYRPDSLVKRDSRVSGGSGAGDIGLFDYNSEEDLKNPSKRPTDIELALRTGRFDKADVDEALRLENEKLRKSAEDKINQEQLERVNSANKSRQKKLDEMLGVDDNNKVTDSI